MKQNHSKIVLALLVLLAITRGTLLGQGTFQNLDFESAVIVPVTGDPFGRVQFAPAFPGWTGYVGTNQQTLALFNNLFVGTAAIALLGPGWSGGGIIAGNYTAVLQAGSDPADPLAPADAYISQVGLIPAGTESIRLVSSGERNGFAVTLNGQQINMTVLGAQNGFNLYGGDASPFAGVTGELRITALSAPSSPANLYLDSIAFSNQSVPEPSVFGLSVLGVLLATCRCSPRPRCK